MISRKVSVIIVCYNTAEFLQEAINSVLYQTYVNWDIIVVDDASTDSSVEIATNAAEKDSRIHCFALQKNMGPAFARNYAIERATGEWVAILDADDICEPTRLEKQVNAALADPSLVYVGTGMTEINEQGGAMGRYLYPSGHKKLVSHLQSARKYPPHSSAFYRTATVREVGGFRIQLRRAEDWDLWLRLSEVGELACLKEPLVRVRKHANQISNDEAGRRQLIDSRIAMISYWLRKKGKRDPVDMNDEAFNTFYTWSERELMNDGLLEFQNYKHHLKMVLKSKKETRASDWLGLGATLVSHPSLWFRFLHERLRGDSIAARLASKWIKTQK